MSSKINIEHYIKNITANFELHTLVYKTVIKIDILYSVLIVESHLWIYWGAIPLVKMHNF